MAKQLHAYYVDRRLSVAKQLLSSIEKNQHSIYEEGCWDAALLQSNFALLHYVNELLVLYNRPTLEIEGNSFQLQEFIISESHSVPELVELKQLLNNPKSWLNIIVFHPKVMIKKGSELAAKPAEKSIANSTTNKVSTNLAKPVGSDSNNKQQKIHLVDVSNIQDDYKEDSHQIDELSTLRVKEVVDECLSLIQRQRENLVEY